MIISWRQKAITVGGHKGSKTIRTTTTNKNDIQVEQKRNNIKFTFGLDEIRCQLSENTYGKFSSAGEVVCVLYMLLIKRRKIVQLELRVLDSLRLLGILSTL